LQDVLVSVNDLQTTFFTKLGPVKAVDGVSFQIKKGETLGIVGESGCGKSVTSYSIMGLIDSPGEVTGGSAYVGDIDILKYSEAEMQKVRGQKVAMIFQEPMTALNPVFTIGFQMDEQIIKHLKLSRKDAKARAVDMLSLVGIPSPEKRYSDYPHQLSGGMRQRAMIAMALSCNPDFLIADEPTTALDVTIQAQILELIQDLQEKTNMTVQFITHDLGVISELSDHVMVMYAGRTCETAASATLFSEPRHPYTNALLGSLPRIGRRVAMLPTIEGTVPSPYQLPKGCYFQNRCAFVSSACRAQQPPLQEVAPGHHVACFNPLEGRYQHD
jgi:peptide/nickel transport system ATP-binding protein